MAGRAASGLLQLAQQHGRPVTDGILIELKVSQNDLGGYLGLSRENTSRQLRQLRDAGLIRLDDARVVILDREGLQVYAETAAD
jgi:CRP/FNR family transcriptional regulator